VGGIGEKTALKLFPFLADRATTADEILQHATANVGSSSRYKSLLESRERFMENIKLMQLSVPILGADSARNIRTVITEEKPSFTLSALALTLSRQGIQIPDSDFISTFKLYQRWAGHAE
jgi:5'-3' exonuclease